MDRRTSDGQKKAVDVGTTGHSWDGITELNTPLPRWWLWLFYATIIWAVGYWVVYPSWPLVSSYARGVSGWHAREGVVQDLAALKAQRSGMTELLAATPLEDVAKNPELMSFARAQGKAAFGDNCAPCHGAGAGGGKGFPNLNDDDWLWGGKLHEIAATLNHGVRWSLDENTRTGGMPAFGRDNILNATQISQVADFTRSLSGLPVDKGADLLAGAKVFAENCASCHGAKGEGNRDLGSPKLTDAIWLYGSDKKAIVDGLWGGRAGAMPAWGGRLDETTQKALTVYVHSLGGGE